MLLRFALPAGLAILSCLAAYLANKKIPGFSVFFLCISLSLLAIYIVGGKRLYSLYVLSFIFLGLSLFEFYSIVGDHMRQRHGAVESRDEIYWGPNAQLGWGPTKQGGRYASSQRTKSGTVIFDVNYTLDAAGLRATPEDKTAGPVLFFGDSFTFGHGVPDHQTFAYVFSDLSGLRVRNFAFGGYGPHQALRMLELDIPKQVEPRPPTHAVYTAIPEHVDRAAGRQWSGPFYRMENGSPVYSGPMAERTRVNTLFSVMARSYVLSALLKPVVLRYSENTDVERFVGIIRRMRDILERDYRSRFVFLYWDIHAESGGGHAFSGTQPRERRVADQTCLKLAEAGVRTIRLSERLPQVRDRAFYLADGHPNAKAHAALASMLVEELR